MNKTKIEWVRNPDGTQGYSWNPIKGICPVGCWYCYARTMYKRFHMKETLEFYVTRGDIAQMDRIPPSCIFICSTIEIFHPRIKKLWRDRIFYTIGQFPKHTFIVLTKMPENIDRPMPDNVWLGVSITGEGQDMSRWLDLEKATARVKFISFEPILTPIVFEADHCPDIPNWTIWGRLTGYGKKRAAFDRRILFDGVDFFKKAGSKVFIKNNLREIWGEPLIQEFPK